MNTPSMTRCNDCGMYWWDTEYDTHYCDKKFTFNKPQLSEERVREIVKEELKKFESFLDVKIHAALLKGGLL